MKYLPVLTKARRASDYLVLAMIDAAHSQRIVCLVFGAIRKAVVKRAQSVFPIVSCRFTFVRYREAKNFCYGVAFRHGTMWLLSCCRQQRYKFLSNLLLFVGKSPTDIGRLSCVL